MTAFKVTTEQLLLPFEATMAAVNIRAFEPEWELARLVCFHGFVGNNRDFDPLAEFLASNGVAVVAADMFGRGDSAHFDNPDHYTLRRMAEAAAAVLKAHGRGATILGSGWGAVIALLGASAMHSPPRSFIAANLKLDYSIEGDPIIAGAMADRGLSFSTAEAALAHLRQSAEFAGLPPGADIANRIRQSTEGYRLSHDDAITQHTQVFGGRNYDLRTMLGTLGAPVLLLDAGPAQPTDMANATAIGGLRPNGPLLFRTDVERYLLLGYLLNGRIG